MPSSYLRSRKLKVGKLPVSDIVLKPLVRVPCAIIERNGKVLAAQRSAGGSLALKWEFPGGKLEVGETEEEALVREIREELCVEIRIGERLSVTDRDDIWRTIRLIPFVCELATEEITLTEHEQILWLTLGELAELDWAEADRNVLLNYFKYLDSKRVQPKLRLTRRQPQTFSISPEKTS